jgi:hypothetical protein
MSAVPQPVALQIQLPAEPVLSPDQLRAITGRAYLQDQLAWLEERGWVYELRGDGKLIVGTLYANLRLAGMRPTHAEAPNDSGFDLSKIR